MEESRPGSKVLRVALARTSRAAPSSQSVPVSLSSQRRNPPAPSQLPVRGDRHTAPEATASPLPPRLHEGPGKAPRSPGTGAAAPARRAGPGARGNSAARRRREVRQGPERRAPCRGTSRCGPGAALRAEPGQGAWAGRQGAAPRGQWRRGKKPYLHNQDAPFAVITRSQIA